MIQLQNVSLTLNQGSRPLQVLRNINAEISSGESVAIVGPSGSGKTSLLMLIAGLTQVTSGNVIVDSVDITNYSEDALAEFRRQRMGIVFQGFHLLPSMTALENTAIPLEIQGREGATETAAEMLSMLGLQNRTSHLPSQLSGGEQQRVALGRAFVHQPKILLADEPTGNLDHAMGEQIMDLLFSFQKKQRSTLLLITHDPILAARCDTQIHLQDGSITPCP